MTRRAAEILEILAERRTVEPRVMIVVAHPDDETIGMGAQLCGFHDALLLQVTDGAPRDGRDAAGTASRISRRGCCPGGVVSAMARQSC
jgi:hypothetical protein